MHRGKSPRRSGLAKVKRVQDLEATKALEVQTRIDRAFKTYAEATGAELTVDVFEEWYYDPETDYVTVAVLVDEVSQISSMRSDLREAFGVKVIVSYAQPKFIVKVSLEQLIRRKPMDWTLYLFIAAFVFALSVASWQAL